jgi:hypothetical protein
MLQHGAFCGHAITTQQRTLLPPKVLLARPLMKTQQDNVVSFMVPHFEKCSPWCEL